MHFGVKGMKWGVRKKRPDNSSSETNQKQQKNGLSTSQKVAIGAAFATAAIAGGILYSKWARDNKDMVIKASKYMQRITIEGKADANKHIYVSVRKRDSKKYLKGFADELRNRKGYSENGGNILVKKYKANSNIKIANTKNAEKIYESLKKSDKDFGDFFSSMSYRSFNDGIPSYSKNVGHLVDKYIQELSKSGYSGVLDEYDKRNGSFRAKSPILFDKSKITLDSVIKMK